MLRYAGAVLLKSTVRACNCAPTLLRRCLASPAAAVEAASDAERAIAAKIASGLQCASIRVADTSGGCGAMYTIEVVSEDFRGISIVKQHQLVTKLLRDDISQWHGFQLSTRPPAQS